MSRRTRDDDSDGGDFPGDDPTDEFPDYEGEISPADDDDDIGEYEGDVEPAPEVLYGGSATEGGAAMHRPSVVPTDPYESVGWAQDITRGRDRTGFDPQVRAHVRTSEPLGILGGSRYGVVIVTARDIVRHGGLHLAVAAALDVDGGDVDVESADCSLYQYTER